MNSTLSTLLSQSSPKFTPTQYSILIKVSLSQPLTTVEASAWYSLNLINPAQLLTAIRNFTLESLKKSKEARRAEAATLILPYLAKD